MSCGPSPTPFRPAAAAMTGGQPIRAGRPERPFTGLKLAGHVPITCAMASRPLTIAVKDHQGKALRFARALQDAGHRLLANGPAEVLLIDLDPPHFGYRELIDRYKSIGATIVLYPHG